MSRLVLRDLAVVVTVDATDSVLRDVSVVVEGGVITEIGEVDYDGLQSQLSRTPGRLRKPGPCVGEDSYEVLSEILGKDADEIADLLAVLKVAAAQLWLVFQQAREVDFAEIALQALHALGRAEEPSELQLQLDHRISHLLID